MKNRFGIRSFVGNGPAGAFFMPYPDCFAFITATPIAFPSNGGTAFPICTSCLFFEPLKIKLSSMIDVSGCAIFLHNLLHLAIQVAQRTKKKSLFLCAY